MQAAGLGWGWLGWAGQDANGVKGPAVAPIETLQTAARRPRFLQAGGLQAAGLAWGWLGWAGQNVEATYEAGCGPYRKIADSSPEASILAGWLG